METKTSPNFEAWKKQMETHSNHEGRVTYREIGPHYNRLDFDDKGYPKCIPTTGPHFVEAVPAPGTTLRILGKLLGSFDHNSDTGKVFFPRKGD
jgi:hypothetical protein